MPLWPDFCGSAYTTRSKSINVDQAINVYSETREIPGSGKQTTLYGTPGRRLVANLGDGPCRGWFTQDGRTWVVVGSTLYEQMNAITYSVIGTVPNDDKLVSFASNGAGGNQLAVVGGGQLNVLNLQTGVYTTVTLPFSHPVTCTFQDGYLIVNQRDTPIMWFSAIENMLSFDALDFFARSGTSDNVIAVGGSQDRVWVFGSKTTTLYYDSGDADTPFLPYQGTTAQNGLVSAQLLAVYRDVFFWVSSGQRGTYRVLSGNAPGSNQVSTRPIEMWLESAPTLDDATMTIYEQEGHVHVCITVPQAQGEIKTYCYDTTETKAPWHARAGFDSVTGTYTPWGVQGATAVKGTVYVGDASSGNLYTLNLDAYTDNGTTIKRARRAPYLGADNQWVFIDQFELGTQPGVGVEEGASDDASSYPTVELNISRDGANTWESAGEAPLGRVGEYETRTMWAMLGRARTDRLVFEVTQTAPVKTVWGPGAWIRLTPGTGQL